MLIARENTQLLLKSRVLSFTMPEITLCPFIYNCYVNIQIDLFQILMILIFLEAVLLMLIKESSFAHFTFLNLHRIIY